MNFKKPEIHQNKVCEGKHEILTFADIKNNKVSHEKCDLLDFSPLYANEVNETSAKRKLDK